MARTSVLTGGSNSAQTTSEDLNGLATDFISDGIVGTVTNTSGVAPMTGGLAINAQGTPDRTTAVTAGTAYVTATPTSQGSQRLRVKIDAQNITHSTNTTGGTRYDWVYVKVDAALAANPIADMSTTGTIVVSRSISNLVDSTPPAYGYHIGTVTLINNYTTITNGTITDTRTQAGAQTTPAQVVAGMPVQIATVSYSAVAAGTTLIPFDDTLPQSSEGDQYMILSFTPKSATNHLFIEAKGHFSSSVLNDMTMALFQDSGANALAVSDSTIPVANYSSVQFLGYDMVAGTTSTITFKIRAGGSVAGTTTFNGAGGGRRFGGAILSYIKVTEYKA
jgi:hypothetical protein